MIVYMATNKINGKMYIGQTIYDLNKRRCGHVASAKGATDSFYFHKAIRKYGPDNFEWEVLDSARNIDELNDLEVFFIKLFKSFGEGYNLNAGGRNFKHSEETKRKMSEAQMGVKNHMYGKLGPLHPSYGKKYPPDFGKKISESRKGKCVGKDNHFYDKKHTKKTKKIISIKNSRPVIIYNKHYKSLKEAAEVFNTNKTNIMRRINRQETGCRYADGLPTRQRRSKKIHHDL